jgi:hypothetical protein
MSKKIFSRPVLGPVDPGGRNHHSHHLLRDEGDARVPRPDALDLCRLAHFLQISSLQRIFIYKNINCRLCMGWQIVKQISKMEENFHVVFSIYPFKRYKLSSLHGLANSAANIRDGGKPVHVVFKYLSLACGMERWDRVE